MAEPAQADPGALISPSAGTTDSGSGSRYHDIHGLGANDWAGADIKQEHDLHGLEGLDFTMPPEFASKRPLEGDRDTALDSEAKRLKTDAVAESSGGGGGGADEESLEDGLALLVQNALSNVGDLVDQFSTDPDTNGEVSDPMDLDATLGLDATTPAEPSVTFFAEPAKYIRQTQSHALGNMVSSSMVCDNFPNWIS